MENEVSWKVYRSSLLLTAGLTALDIGLSNWSFLYVTTSLYMVTKSSSILFISMFGVMLGLEKRCKNLFLVATLISTGLFFFSYEYWKFNKYGFMLLIAASIVSGIRWSMTQYLMRNKEYKMLSPIDVQYNFQPWMALLILPLSLNLEAQSLYTNHYFFRPQDFAEFLNHWSLIFVSIVLTIGLEISEYAVVLRTSSVTLSVATIMKEMISILLASLQNGKELTALSLVGVFMCLVGILIHFWDKLSAMRIAKNEVLTVPDATPETNQFSAANFATPLETSLLI
ncbi:hypothetical protein Ciccas_011962 [Cichlidogyrus casuarinus]|uniref:Sugar phosphate transporter domain-containing protein n=1 Tax=Cichlidogyrus casuarinus TaxID=1844966 RepID=A0ABD2PPS0_9PLAT